MLFAQLPGHLGLVLHLDYVQSLSRHEEAVVVLYQGSNEGDQNVESGRNEGKVYPDGN